MPLYEYKCPEHGVFQELATMADHDKPCDCPQCGTTSARVITLPPQLLAMLKENREAMERNEKAQHEPQFLTPAQYREQEAEKKARAAHKHKHGSGCGCQSERKSKLFYTADGSKMFPSMRPWMISH
ncbi:hypothetical protein GCM10011348_46630 [Marinobacterium nitratireducens]|uniref:Putative regulatory protein FmdB zinc ribbon domain-containing protein n=1 Tax=Marinobacterium nitratireducens TaxID=518897 RepID=A0A917ZSD5_9GAMM|nr:zinc ribbon domain-containing protein [Marinobacterium nitratireducens]GGO89272.1 hypothetical protein GCM10011348_46630 [Marinobacterium nitratireducens]